MTRPGAARKRAPKPIGGLANQPVGSRRTNPGIMATPATDASNEPTNEAVPMSPQSTADRPLNTRSCR